MKDEEDQDKPYSTKRPSIWRDWLEISEIMERVRPPPSDSTQGDSGAPAQQKFVRLLHRSSFNWEHAKDLHTMFRSHAILLLEPTPNQVWGRFRAEEILQQRSRTRVPVHGEFHTLY